ncbi:MAG: non-ribosomal peptide synthetase, partial [Planctomycetes bacterium]|nr:non-ribosomal peptide synthetase [Planctomycetota bacterium]
MIPESPQPKSRRTLTASQRARLDERIRGALAKPAGATQIAHAPHQTDFPLTFSQERLWFLEQFDPGNSVYNRPVNLRLTGDLDVAALEQSFRDILRRHEILRICIKGGGTAPRQQVTNDAEFHWAVHDLSTLDEAALEAESEQLLRENNCRPFDLEQGPLYRVTLVRRQARDHLLAVTFHHIIFDGWSERVLRRELSELYSGYVQHRPATLPALPIQYGDFAHWQRTVAEGQKYESDLRYWEQQLTGAPACLSLPTDFPRPAVQRSRGATLPLEIDATLTAQLRDLGQAHNATLFMVLLAGWKALLWRYTQQDDIVVGTPIAGRNLPEVEELIGLFINSLALRTDLSGNPTGVELMARIRKVALEAFAHQELPFEKLVAELQPERNLSFSPLFQVMLVLHNTPRRNWDLAAVTVEPRAAPTGTSKFDVTIALTEVEGRLVGECEYDTDLFQEATIRRLCDQYR